jgi:NADH dehydrogenase
MISEQNRNGATERRRALIVGAGYGGLRAALRLASIQRSAGANLEVVLLDMNDYHQLITELHEVAGGRTPVEAVRLPLREVLNGTGVSFIQARVTDFDFDHNLVRVEQREADGSIKRGKIRYDWLVMALGSTTAFYRISGLKEYAYTLKSSWEADRLYKHVVEMFQQASRLPAGDTARKAMLTFVVGGGGYTGVELAGELAAATDRLCADYKIARDDVNLWVVEMKATILPGYEQWMIDYTSAALRRMGVKLLTSDGVAGVEADAVTLQAGRSIATRTIVWVGGVQARQETQSSGGETGQGGRLSVNRYLQSCDYPNVYAIGDNGVQSEGQTAPSSAQVALQQADTVTANIISAALGQPQRRRPFKANLAGEVISIGSRDGVALVKGVHITGFAAAILKSLVEKRYRLSLQSGPLGNMAMFSTFVLERIAVNPSRSLVRAAQTFPFPR